MAQEESIRLYIASIKNLQFALFVSCAQNALIFRDIVAFAQSNNEPHNRPMTEKEIVLETIRTLPHDCTIEEIAERIEFMVAVQKVSINSKEAKTFLTTK